jgi:hypothetical protein
MPLKVYRCFCLVYGATFYSQHSIVIAYLENFNSAIARLLVSLA